MRQLMARLCCALTGAVLGLFLTQNPVRADIITEWNQTALTTLLRAQLPSGAPTRGMAMVHLAMFEAVNSIEPRFQPFKAYVDAPAGASAPAAASAAAYRVLASLLPGQESTLERRHQVLLAGIPEGADKAAGISVGERAAAAILALCADDGADFSPAYTPVAGPGRYVLTSTAVMASPSLGKMRPFILERSSQFRPPPPPALDSEQFLRDLAEVKAIGDKASTIRTKAQTDIALYHVPPGFIPWNAIARHAVQAKALDIVQSARAMALLNFATMDSQLAIWDAKYTYNSWRPATAIRAGGGSTFTALLSEPMHPEYPCAHCGVGAASSLVLQGLFGSGPFPFSVASVPTAAPRSFNSIREYEEEEAISRLYGGVHFRWSNVVGEIVGKQVGERVLDALKPKN
jgi:hypothetical protein